MLDELKKKNGNDSTLVHPQIKEWVPSGKSSDHIKENKADNDMEDIATNDKNPLIQGG